MLVPMMLSVASATAVSYSYRAKSSSNSNLSSYTFSGLDINSAASDRHIHVVVHYGGGGDSFTSVSIGGVSATQNSVNAGSSRGLAIYTAKVTSGTTADVVVTLGNTASSCAVGVWASYGLSSAAAYRVATDTSAPITATIGTINGGFCIAGLARSVSGAGSVVWTNVTERYDDNIDANNLLVSSADSATTGSDISPSAAISGSGTVSYGIFASFG